MTWSVGQGGWRSGRINWTQRASRAFEMSRGNREGYYKPDNLMDLVYPKFAN